MKIVFLDLSTFRKPGEVFDYTPLQNLGEFVHFEETGDSELLRNAGDAQVVLTIKNRLFDPLLSELKSAKLICKAGSGYDNIDVKASHARGIGVCNLPHYGDTMVAQWTWSLLLSLAGSLRNYDIATRRERGWKAVHYAFPICELQGKTLGLVGYGQIAQHVARWANAFGMKVLIYSRFRQNLEFEQCDLKEIAERSDFVSLHSRLDDSTRGLINSEFLSRMKPTSYLINTARAAIIDEEALIKSLQTHSIAGAALDVFWEEPPRPDHPLLSMEHVIVTPHMAWGAHETRQRIIDQLGQVIQAYFNGKPIHLISPK